MPFVKGHKPMGGRPKGSTTLIKAKDYFTEKEMKEFWDDLKKRAKKNDRIALYFAEQFTGKALQPHEGDLGGGIIIVKYDDAFEPKNVTTPSKAKNNS